MGEDEQRRIRDEFRRVVNMAPKELEEWLETEESRSVGYTREGENEAVGHQSGRRIVAIRRTRQDELSDDDYAHMQRSSGTCIATVHSARTASKATRAGATR